MMGVKNDIPHGYKQTELGIIPEDWEVVAFKDLGSFSKGSGISRAEANTGRIPCIRYGELYTHHNDYVKSFNSFISQEVASKAKLIKNGDILFAASGETKEDIGKSVAYTNLHEAYAGGDIIIVSTNSFICDAKYIGYASNAPIAAKQKATRGQGDAVVHITTESIKSIAIPLPPLPEQQAIAEALSDVDDLIAALDKKIAKKRLVKQGAMQQLLTGKKRLPGFTEEWVEKKLGDISRIKTGSRNGDEAIENGKYPFFVRSQKIYSIDSYSFEGEAILVPGEGGIGNIFHYVNGKFDYHQRVYKISNFSDSICGKYVYFYMTRYFGEYALSLTVKATVDSLRLPTFKEFVIKAPVDIKEQQAIAAILSDMDKEIANLEKQRENYCLLKSGMMQKLLTGQIRLKTK